MQILKKKFTRKRPKSKQTNKQKVIIKVTCIETCPHCFIRKTTLPVAFSFSSKIAFIAELIIIIIIIIIDRVNHNNNSNDVQQSSTCFYILKISRRDNQLISIYLNFFVFIKIIIAYCFFNVFYLRDNTF